MDPWPSGSCSTDPWKQGWRRGHKHPCQESYLKSTTIFSAAVQLLHDNTSITESISLSMYHWRWTRSSARKVKLAKYPGLENPAPLLVSDGVNILETASLISGMQIFDRGWSKDPTQSATARQHVSCWGTTKRWYYLQWVVEKSPVLIMV